MRSPRISLDEYELIHQSSQRPGDRVEIESEMSGRNGVPGDTRAYDRRHIKQSIVWNHCGEGERDAKK